MTPSLERGSLVLVVEDSDEDFDTAQQGLADTHLSARLQRATSGDEALDELARYRAPPALILLDLNTPGTDGRDALASLRASPRYRRVPIVVLTTSENPRDISFCYAAGANAYHTKPVNYLEHRAVVALIMRYWLDGVTLPTAESA